MTTFYINILVLEPDPTVVQDKNGPKEVHIGRCQRSGRLGTLACWWVCGEDDFSSLTYLIEDCCSL